MAKSDKMTAEDRVIRLEVVVDALIETLIEVKVITADQIQEKILELAEPEEGEDELEEGEDG